MAMIGTPEAVDENSNVVLPSPSVVAVRLRTENVALAARLVQMPSGMPPLKKVLVPVALIRTQTLAPMAVVVGVFQFCVTPCGVVTEVVPSGLNTSTLFLSPVAGDVLP